MPEGDVLWRTARRLSAVFTDQVLVGWDLRWPSLATTDLTGRTVTEVVSVGKHLLIRVAAHDGPSTGAVVPGSATTLHSHLRMEGSWHVHATPTAPDGRPDPSRLRASHSPDVRALLATAAWTAVGLRLGELDLIPTGSEHELIGHLGPDVLGPDWDAAEAVRRLTADPARPVGEALLDQRVLAGVGTFFMTEACFLRGVSPWTPVGDLRDPAAVVDTAYRMLQANKHRASQITTGDSRPGRERWVHARSGRPCLRCGTTILIASIGVAPHDRVASWCPRCQPGPTPTGTQRAPVPLRHRRRAAP